MRQPRQPSEAQLRLAYLEGFHSYFEDDLPAPPPDIGPALRPHWLRGWKQAESFYEGAADDPDVIDAVLKGIREEAEDEAEAEL